MLPKGRYDVAYEDDENYGSCCYAFDADFLNTCPRYSVDGNGERIE